MLTKEASERLASTTGRRMATVPQILCIALDDKHEGAELKSLFKLKKADAKNS
jgi:hypothetical protein